VVASLTTLFLVVLGSIIYINIWDHTKDLREKTNEAGIELADSIYTSMIFPMSRGDGRAIRKQLAELRQSAKNMEVLLFGSDKKIVYASKEGGKQIAIPKTKDVKPHQVIPLDDDDFKDF